MLFKPFDGIRETDLIELVGVNHEVNTSDFGTSVVFDVSLETKPVSGEFLSFAFIATESGSGGVQDSQGELLILDADPALTFGDTALTAAQWKTVVGRVKITAADWTTDGGGGIAYVTDQPVPFQDVDNLWFVWFHTDAQDLNDVAGDDELLQVNARYVRYS